MVYEFVVAGTLGPITRSKLDGLKIVDLGVETWLRLTRAGDEKLLSLLSSSSRETANWNVFWSTTNN